jgi:hypothetical protein
VSERHAWMRPALARLFDEVDLSTATEAVRDESRRADLRERLNQSLDSPIAGGEYEDNLLMGLLALRIKFDRQTAEAKLELNLAIRAERSAM